MSKQLKKSESKKPENPDDSAIGSDPDSQHSLQEIANILRQLQLDVTGIRSDISALCDQVDNNADDIKQLKHRNSDLTDTINNVRGFNRELLSVTSDFKKDVHDYLGFPSSPLSSPLSHLSSFGDPMRNSFRMVLEKIGNPLDPLPNHHFQTFLCHYTKWQIYRDRGGSMSLYGYVQNSPAVFDIYLANAKTQDPSFVFNPLHDNEKFFGQLIDYVFFPTGFDLHAFEILIKDKRMRSFSIAAAGQYAFDVNVILQALTSQLEPLNTSDLWKVVSNYVFPPAFQKFLLPRVPRLRTKFLAYIDQSAKLYDQRVSMDFEIRRSQDDPSHSLRPSNPSSPSRSHTLNPDQRARVNEVRTTPVASDQVCTNCHRIGLHRPEFCPVIDHMISLRLDHAVHPDSITEDDINDLDFSFE
jgi:hypothetical protein